MKPITNFDVSFLFCIELLVKSKDLYICSANLKKRIQWTYTNPHGKYLGSNANDKNNHTNLLQMN